jgi:hypothetical protein
VQDPCRPGSCTAYSGLVQPGSHGGLPLRGLTCKWAVVQPCRSCACPYEIARMRDNDLALVADKTSSARGNPSVEGRLLFSPYNRYGSDQGEPYVRMTGPGARCSFSQALWDTRPVGTFYSLTDP